MKKVVLLPFIFFSLHFYAQKEANFWYFGQNAALDFNSGTPVPVTGSQLNTVEGCSSFSDANGNLLFYVGAPNTNARDLTIWNRNNQPMPRGTGLRGDSSSSQSALTIPASGRPNIYYLFTVGTSLTGSAGTGIPGFFYYEIDMTADGGLGDVTVGPVNLSNGLDANWTEKVTAVRADACNTFWAISLIGNTFYAYRLDTSGVDVANPVTSTLPGFSANDIRGYLKVSPDGSTLVAANMNSGTYIFRFDDVTGRVTNFENPAAASQLSVLGQSGYGVEFSPTSRVLYVSTGNFTPGSTEHLYQFDLTQTNIADINASRYEVHTYNNSRGALQLGPDGKIYWTSHNSRNISVVNAPDQLGRDCNYSHQTVNLGTTMASQGLPPFLSSLLLPVDITDDATGQTVNNQTLQYCIGDTKTLLPGTVTGTNISYEWAFDNGTSSSVISTDPSLTLADIALTDAGDYSLTIRLTDDCSNLVELNGVFTIDVFEPPVAIDSSLINDIQFCDTDGDGLHIFDLSSMNTTILNGQDPTVFEVVYSTVSDFSTLVSDAAAYQNSAPFSTDTIYIRLRNSRAPNACYDDDSFTLQVTSEPTPVSPSDYVVCDVVNSGSSDTDGIYQSFDFSSKDSEILGSLSNTLYSVSYHLSQSDAQTNTNPIDKTTPYTNTTAFSQEIFVRVDNNNNTNCNAFTLADQTASFNSFFLVVVPQPKATLPADIPECSTTGRVNFDLNSLKDNEVLNGQDPGVFNVVYFPTRQDAIDNTNPLPNPYQNRSDYSTETIWVRVFHTMYPTTCSDTNQTITSFQLFVTQNPDGLIQTLADVSRCDTASAGGTDTDGIINDFITLSSKDAEILGTDFFNSALYTVSYHLTATDATNDTNPIDKINPYTNTTPNGQTIYVRVGHNDNPTACVAYTNFDLIVHPLPVITTPVDLRQCDDDTDGFSAFNLTEANRLLSADFANETFVYYPTMADAQANTNAINNPTAFTNRTTPTDTLWVRISNTNNCHRIAQLNLIVSTTGIPNTFARTFNTCDDFLPTDGINGTNDDTDGVSAFDFSSVNSQVRALFPPTQQLTITYYRNATDALAENNAVSDISNYRNIGYPNSQQIYIRVDSQLDNACLGFGPYITLTVDPIPVANTISDYELCETLDDGDGTNGIIQTFDLQSQTPGILASQDPARFSVTYHQSAGDARTGSNPLASPYTNTTRDRQTIYVRVTNNNTGCYNHHSTFDIVVTPLPIANFVNDLEICDDNTDGSARNGFSQSINLESQTPGILASQDPARFSVTYHRNLAEAQSGSNPQISPFSNTTPHRQTIYVRVVSSVTGCANGISNFDVVVNPEPVFTPVSNISICDDNADGDDTNGFVQNIDLQSVIPMLLLHPTDPSVIQDPDDFNVTFHASQAQASAASNPLPNPFANTVANMQTIYVRIENKTTGCINDDASFNVIINPLPDFRVNSPRIVCLNGPPLTLRAENPADTYDYTWTDPVGNTSSGSTLTVTAGGHYTITATTTNGTNCSRVRTIQVNESIIPTITQNDLTIVDDSDNNSITVNPDNLGIGDYQYALADQNNLIIRDFKDEPFFDRLQGGFYNLIVRDKNGCGQAAISLSIIEFPKFFTPNNDGINDTWRVKGINAALFPTNAMYIFNRYGKVVATISIDSQGWNGNYGGKPLPSDDYWFSVNLTDSNGNTRLRKGNFSLIRK
ncbi:MAG: T9SS type B sorting domain-containing protein [Flavobacteriaceae bacterium]|nr:MAG: T9SS type B sorting domain-containing protein [Flavobacteriaceae bacterium]